MMQFFGAVMIVVTMLLSPLIAVAAQPQWVESFQQGSLVSNDAYIGVGMAQYQNNSPDYQCRRLSKDRALDDLSYQLSVSITSLLKEQLGQKGSYSQEQISSSLFVSTRKVLNGIEEKEKWIDSKERRFWVMLAIDKKSAENQVKQQDFINEVIDRLEKKQVEINAGIKKLNTLFDDHTQRINSRMQRMEGMLNRINTKLDTSTEYTLFMQKLQDVGQQWQHQGERVDDQTNQLNLLMLQNQTLTQQLAQILATIEKDRFLSMVDDDVKNQQADERFKVTILPEKGPHAYYEEGETIRFRVTSNRDGYIKVIYTNSISDHSSNEKSMNTLLFPNLHDRNNKITAGQALIIGRRDELVVEPPFGKDIITVIASPNQFTDIDDILKNSAGGYYSYETQTTRGTVKARGVGVKEKVTDTCLIITRAR